MNALVLDASVAAKWYLPSAHEPNADRAMDLFRRYARGECRFLVPDLFWAELANILWKSARVGRISSRSAALALATMPALGFTTVPSRELLKEAFAIATTFDRTVYDSLYVALAVTAQASFVTADEKLANALAAQVPVRWLGAI